MASFFILFAAVSFICVMVIKSSINYDFGSHQKRTIIRTSVVVATVAAVIAHYILATGLLHFIWTGPTGDEPAAALAILFAAATTGTLIWGFLIPKVVFSFVGTKPPDTDERDETEQYVDEIILPYQHEQINESDATRQQPQTNKARPQNEEDPPTKSKKPILTGVASAALLGISAIVAAVFTLTSDSPTKTTLRDCDNWLQQQLLASSQPTARPENANAVVTAIQTQRSYSCPPGAWNPVVTNVVRDNEGNIDISFAAANGNARGTAVTRSADGVPRWVYLATEAQWYSHTTHDP